MFSARALGVEAAADGDELPLELGLPLGVELTLGVELPLGVELTLGVERVVAQANKLAKISALLQRLTKGDPETTMCLLLLFSGGCGG